MPLQDPLILNIKGMVCDRCIRVLRQEFEQMGLPVEEIKLGTVRLSGTSRLESMMPIQQAVEKNGFELLGDKKQQLIEQIQAAVKQFFQDEMPFHQEQKIAAYLSEQLKMHYDSLSTFFSSQSGITLEHYAQEKRLEKVKELLVYTELSLTEIAARSGFSSVNHLSNHFKSQTGLPPSHFRKIQSDKEKVRKE
ncbi:MAG: helix-turn-helix domain-containing protein [Cyclobacteriaceae bacterium]